MIASSGDWQRGRGHRQIHGRRLQVRRARSGGQGRPVIPNRLMRAAAAPTQRPGTDDVPTALCPCRLLDHRHAQRATRMSSTAGIGQRASPPTTSSNRAPRWPALTEIADNVVQSLVGPPRQRNYREDKSKSPLKKTYTNTETQNSTGDYVFVAHNRRVRARRECKVNLDKILTEFAS